MMYNTKIVAYLLEVRLFSLILFLAIIEDKRNEVDEQNPELTIMIEEGNHLDINIEIELLM